MATDCAVGVRDALDRTVSEREQVLAKRRAIERSERHVRKLAMQSARPPAGTTRATACGATLMAAATQRDDAAGEGRRRIRELFTKAICPYSISDVGESKPLAVTIRKEFNPEATTALSPGTESRSMSATKEAIMSATTERQRGLGGMCRALDGEKRLLRTALTVLDEYEDWVIRADETPLPELGFDALRRRHEALAGRHEACDRLIHGRQRHLSGAAYHTATVEADHRFLVTYLYEDRATDYPTLAIATRVDDSCADCQ